LLDLIALESLRLERCQHHDLVLRDEQIVRARESWHEDRQAAADQLARGLAKRPGLVAARLIQTAQGAAWMIERWEVLQAALTARGCWTDEEQSRALDLLGVPVDEREADPEDTLDDRLRLVADELAWLRAYKSDVLDPRDSRIRGDAAIGVFHDDEPPALRRVRRYTADCQRRLSWALREFHHPGSAPASSRSWSDTLREAFAQTLKPEQAAEPEPLIEPEPKPELASPPPPIPTNESARPAPPARPERRLNRRQRRERSKQVRELAKRERKNKANGILENLEGLDNPYRYLDLSLLRRRGLVVGVRG
jgi:hypothetical protein